MLRRNLLIGGLVAGAFVLPTLAQAGVVTGACVSCHTMHASQNGAAIAGAPNAQLLLGSGCVGCHTGGANGAATGKDAAKFGAPQISDTTNVLSGGYMLVAAAPNTVHNITDGAYFTTPDTITQPGSAGSRSTNAATGGFTCSDCHDATGGHHGTAATNYRLLQGVTGQAGQTDYGVQPFGTANGNGDRKSNTYNATTMNAFCASCHGAFHGLGVGFQTNAAGAFIRHPTDVSVNASAGPSIQNITQTTDIDQTPVGRSNAGAADHVMCLSCHVPHGSARADLLSFSYDATFNAAGGTTKSVGCETCHSYGSNGM